MKDKELMLLMHKRAEHAEMANAGPVNTWSATHLPFYVEGRKNKNEDIPFRADYGGSGLQNKI